MGLFDFLKRKKKTEAENTVTKNTSSAPESENKSVLGMVLLNDPNSLDINQVIVELKEHWSLTLGETKTNNETSFLTVDGYGVVIATMPMPIPGDEVKSAASFNYFWQNAEQEATAHKGHVIISIIGGGDQPVKENILFSKVASAIMNNSDSIGLYMGSRTLVLEKNFYEANVHMMNEENLPLYIWVYFGLHKANGKNSCYTFGLKAFGKQEMEIVDSDKSLEDLNQMMYGMASYVVSYDINLKPGETIGISAEQKLKITESKGRLLEGNTLKIEY